MKFVTNMKEGFNDIKNMLLEHNYRPFIRPVAVLLIVGIGVSFFNNKAETKILDINRKIEAQKAEIDNEQEYKTSKATYEKLVKVLPPIDKKNEWLLAQIISIFKKAGIETTRTGKHILEEDGVFLLSSVNIEAELNYEQLGKLVEAIENNQFFMRVSNISASREQGNLGKVKANMQLHTVFIDEKK